MDTRKIILLFGPTASGKSRLSIDIAKSNPQCTFYAYTKEVKMFKEDISNMIPNNFIVIYSYGGKQDHLIDRDNDRHSDVFPDYDEMIKLGYKDIEEDDKLVLSYFPDYPKNVRPAGKYFYPVKYFLVL